MKRTPPFTLGYATEKGVIGLIIIKVLINLKCGGFL